MLLTTLEVKSIEDALRVIDYYKQRWGGAQPGRPPPAMCFFNAGYRCPINP
jgi:hypothetical protein